MTATLDLPTGETVTPDDVFAYDGYPYRFRPLDHDEYDFLLSPLYWGDSGMDIPFTSTDALADQWDDSAGVKTADEWRAWLADARDDHRFGDDELDALAVELGLADPSTLDDRSVLARVRDALPF